MHRYWWFVRGWLVGIKSVDSPEEDVVGLGSLILVPGGAGDDQIAKEGEAVDIVGVQFLGEEVRVVDGDGLMSGSAVGLELFESRHRPETHRGVLATRDQPSSIGMEFKGHDRPFVAFAGKQSHAGLLLVRRV